MHADEWKLSYFEFRSLRKFTDKLTFLWHLLDLKLRKMRRKLKQSLGVPFLIRELYGFARTDLCFSRCRQVVCEMFIYCYLGLHCKIDPRRKNDISGYIWHGSFIQTAKCSLLDEKIVLSKFLRCAAHV